MQTAGSPGLNGGGAAAAVPPMHISRTSTEAERPNGSHHGGATHVVTEVDTHWCLLAN